MLLYIEEKVINVQKQLKPRLFYSYNEWLIRSVLFKV